MTDPDARAALKTLATPPPRERWPLRLMAFAVALIAVAGIALVVNAGQTQDTAMKATTTAQKATRLLKDKPSKTDLSKKASKKQVTRIQRRLTIVTKNFTKVIKVLGEPGPAGVAGVNGKNAVVDFTLQDLIDKLSPALTGAIADRLPGVVEANCGGSCNGRDGADGKDATADQIDAAVDRHCAPLNDCVSTVPGPQGVPGADSQVPGPQGATGATGTPGADSTVPGPQGPSIASWSFTDATGQTQTCTDPDGDLNYACVVTG